jgi:hypothetical protein
MPLSITPELVNSAKETLSKTFQDYSFSNEALLELFNSPAANDIIAAFGKDDNFMAQFIIIAMGLVELGITIGNTPQTPLN